MNATLNTIQKDRYLYVDYLRLLMIILVVMVHLAVTYSAIGSWYYYEPKELDELSLIIFALFQSFTQSYFMGFLFLLAGFFVPGSYDRKGFSEFITSRLFRLGIPTMIYMLIIHPLNSVILSSYYGMERTDFFKEYTHYISSLDFIGSTGPLWFALALLIFSIIYAFVRKLFPREILTEEEKRPSNLAALGLIIMIALGTFLMRLVQPIGTDIINMQLCFFIQYIILFVVGMKAYRKHWFELIDYKWGIKWLKSAFIIGIPLWLTVLIFGGAMTKGFDPFFGGFNWTSFAYASWESYIAVSMAIGLIALFKEKFNKKNRIGKALSDSSFTVYLFHAPIIIAICYSMRDLHMAPIFKFLLASTICLPVSFALAHFVLRRIPLLKKVL